jgi:hypothetical protein
VLVLTRLILGLLEWGWLRSWTGGLAESQLWRLQ